MGCSDTPITLANTVAAFRNSQINEQLHGLLWCPWPDRIAPANKARFSVTFQAPDTLLCIGFCTT